MGSRLGRWLGPTSKRGHNVNAIAIAEWGWFAGGCGASSFGNKSGQSQYRVQGNTMWLGRQPHQCPRPSISCCRQCCESPWEERNTRKSHGVVMLLRLIDGYFEARWLSTSNGCVLTRTVHACCMSCNCHVLNKFQKHVSEALYSWTMKALVMSENRY